MIGVVIEDAWSVLAANTRCYILRDTLGDQLVLGSCNIDLYLEVVLLTEQDHKSIGGVGMHMH